MVLYDLFSIPYRLYYDGHSDFNFDCWNLFFCGFLFDYLHLMIEGCNPLAAYTLLVINLMLHRVIPNQHQLLLWELHGMLFHASLTLAFGPAFFTPVCGAEPSTMICDSKMLGFRKARILYHIYHHLSTLNGLSSPSIAGTDHQDRVLLKPPRSHEILLKYAGITRDRKKVQSSKPLTQSEMKTLCSSICKDGFESLVLLINHLTTQAGKHTCPEPYKEFLSEISRYSPACGLFQFGDNGEVVDSLQKLVQNSLHPEHFITLNFWHMLHS